MALSIVKMMKQRGVSIEEIVLYTNLTVEEINGL